MILRYAFGCLLMKGNRFHNYKWHLWKGIDAIITNGNDIQHFDTACETQSWHIQCYVMSNMGGFVINKSNFTQCNEIRKIFFRAYITTKWTQNAPIVTIKNQIGNHMSNFEMCHHIWPW